MFALSEAMPTSFGVTTKFTPSLGDLLPAAFEEGQDVSFYGKARQGLDNRVAAGDDPLVAGIQTAMGEPPPSLMSVEELNKAYGMPGLVFDRPQTEALAKLRHQRQKQTLEYQYMAEQLPKWGFLPTSPRGILAFGANMAGSIANPIDLAILAFASPVEAESLAARAIPVFSRFPQLTTSIVNNATQQAIIEIPRIWTDIQTEGTPDWKGVAADMVVGGAFAEGMRIAGHFLARVSKTTLEAMSRKAVNDVLSGKPIDISENLKQDPAVIRHELEIQRLRQAEERLKTDPQVTADVAARVESLMADKKWLEVQVKEVNSKGHLSPEEATNLVRSKVTALYTDTYVSARAAIKELGHVGNVSRRGLHVLAKDFVAAIADLSDAEKAAIAPTSKKIQEILNESQPAELTKAQAKAIAKDVGVAPTPENLKRIQNDAKPRAADISNSQALRIAKELGLNYDWKGSGYLPASAGGIPSESMFAPGAKGEMRGKELVIKQLIVNEAKKKELVGDMVAREKLLRELIQKELEARIRKHAEEVIRHSADPEGPQPLGPEQPPVADVRVNSEEKIKESVPNSKIDVADVTQQKAMTQASMKELESMGELTPEEKAFLEEPMKDTDSEDFVKAALDAAAGCVTGITNVK